jgi:hypothetical protein
LLLVPVVALLALALPWVAPGGAFASWGLQFAGLLLIVIATALVVAAARGVTGALAALVLFAALDQALYGLSFIRHVTPTDLAAFRAAVNAPPAAAGQRVRDGAQDRHENRVTLRGLTLADGYVGLFPRQELDYGREEALRVAGVTWTRRGSHWVRVARPLPRARLVTAARPSDRPAEDLAVIDLASTALVAGDAPSLPGGTPGTADLVSDRPGRITVRTDSATRQLLVLAESHHRGWRVRVDGVERPLLRVNGDFLGCVVEQGRHEAAFSFEPASLVWGRRASVLGLLSLVGALVWSCRRTPPPEKVANGLETPR